MSKKRVIYELADKLGKLLLNRKWRCAVAESCTGGGLASAITDIAGSSHWFDRGFVTYTNKAKEEMLAVPASVLSRDGAVSEATVRAMAQGVMAISDADLSVAISGIAGPGGGSTEKPVGTVWIAWAGNRQPTQARHYCFEGDRAAIRQQAVQAALEGLIQRCVESEAQTGLERYFFALWPGDKEAQALSKRSHSLSEPNQGKLVLAENLHMTLVYLGPLAPDVVPSVKQMASQLNVAPFELQFTYASYWPHIHLRWLGVDVVPPELLQLVQRLKHGLSGAGIKPEKSPYIPHVTIAKQCSLVSAFEQVKSFSWTIDEFCLVKSLGVEGQSNYKIIHRWSL